MKILINILTIILATLLLLTVGVVGFIYRILYSIFTGYNLTKYLNKVAVSLDQLGNVVGGALLNDTLVKGIRPFGLEDDTISEILSYNRKYLTNFGRFIAYILEKIDVGHLDKSLKENETYE